MSQPAELTAIALGALPPVPAKGSTLDLKTVAQSNTSLATDTSATDNARHAPHTSCSPAGSAPSSRLLDVECAHIESTDESQPLLFQDYPDGGLVAWLVVLGSFFGLIVNFGIINSLSALEAYIAKHQLKNVDTSTVGWVFSIHLMVTLNGSVWPEKFGNLNSRMLSHAGRRMYDAILPGSEPAARGP